MMWKRLIPKTIQGKLMAVTAVITAVITIITTTVCFTVFQNFLRKNQAQSAEFGLSVVSNNIGADMRDIIYFSKWCCSNKAVTDYLDAFKDQPKLPTASEDTENLRPLALKSYSRLKEEYYNTRPRDYITHAIVSTENGANFLMVAAAADYSSSRAASQVLQADYYSQLYESRAYEWIGMVGNLFSRVSTDQFIPIIRPINNEFNSEIIGWVYVEISSKMFTDYLTSYPLLEDSSLYLTIGGRTYGASIQGWEETSNPYEVLEDLTERNSFSEGTRVLSVKLKNGEKRILVERPIEGGSEVEGWYLSQVLSKQQLKQQQTIYLLLITGICLAIFFLMGLLTFLLNRIIAQPIKKLCGRIDAVSAGDFSRDEAIEWDHELGQIGRGINSMSESIDTLMEKRVKDEKQKKDLEYQILQSQINPHFLYNTLNSIKWMATIQNASGIADMTTALARLLKNVSKGGSSMITLREELDLVKDYFLIQQYRYGGSVTMEYFMESEDLYACEIHRFSLQPIIENALFHGIEPKGTAGKITVKVQTAQEKQRKTLKISITDNGVGMTEDTIEKVLKEDTSGQNKTEFFRHVGISNVNQRIKYEFGPEYGISILSQPGLYTTMTISMPCILHSDTINKQEEEK